MLLPAGVTACAGDDASSSDLQGQKWVLVEGVPIPLGTAATPPDLTFAEETLAGTTGCNRYGGPYMLDGDTIEIGDLASTAIGCPEPAASIERAYLEALGAVEGWRLDGAQLPLTGADELELLRFSRPG